LEEIFKAVPMTHPNPTCDGVFLDFVPTFADIEDKNPRLFPEWMDAVMFGCTKDDVLSTSSNVNCRVQFLASR